MEVFNLSPFEDDPGLTMAMRLSIDSFRNETVFASVPGPLKSPSQRTALVASIRGDSTRLTLPMRVKQLRQVEVCHPEKLAGLLTQKGKLRCRLTTSEEARARQVLECGCPICLSPDLRGLVTKPACCGSIMHTECVVQWVQLGHASCPVCRAALT
jgi:hypothetical protein